MGPARALAPPSRVSETVSNFGSSGPQRRAYLLGVSTAGAATGGPGGRRLVFPSPLHDERVAAILGIALGVTFSVCFLTGLYSHYQQEQNDALFVIPARPIGLYRLTQGLHVATGIASVPLLVAKLWTVLPSFYEWPPVRSVDHLVQRLMLVPLVAGSLFMLFSGVGNIALWRPWGFDFRRGHHWVAWITIGALIAHMGAKWTTTHRALRRHPAGGGSVYREAELAATPFTTAQPADGQVGGLTRRGFLMSVAAASGVLTVATVGQTFGPLDRVSVLAPRRPGTGPQGVPVNRTAAQAGVTEVLADPGYRLVVSWPGGRRDFTYQELRAMPLHEAVLPIACVEGWSADGHWRGIRVRDLAGTVGRSDPGEVVVRSLQEGSLFTSSRLNRAQAADRDALLALDLNGEPLHPDHGFPLRLIVGNRAGVLQTKWIDRVELA